MGTIAQTPMFTYFTKKAATRCCDETDTARD